MKLDIKVTGDHHKLEALADKAKIPRPALQSFARWAKRQIVSNVNNSLDPYGKRWKSLAASTLESKVKVNGAWSRRDSFGTKPLIVTGSLRDSFTFKTTKDNQLSISNKTDYFKYHQSDLPRRKLPRRPSLPDTTSGFPDSWNQRMQDELELHFR